MHKVMTIQTCTYEMKILGTSWKLDLAESGRSGAGWRDLGTGARLERGIGGSHPDPVQRRLRRTLGFWRLPERAEEGEGGRIRSGPT